MQPYQNTWMECINRKTGWFGEGFSKDRIPVMTYAKFGVLSERFPSFVDNLEIVICDEIHNLPRFSTFICGDSTYDKQYHDIAKRYLEEAVINERSVFVGLSATPKRAETELYCPCKYITVDSDVRRYETKETSPYTNINQVLEQISPNDKGIVYIGHITKMQEFEEEAKRKGFNPISIWSINNKDHPMNPAQLAARQFILDNATLPQDYNLFIINASSETSINIYGEMDYVVVHKQEEETQIQVRGRYRGDLKRLFVYDQTCFPRIPEEFIGCELYKDEKDILCAYLNLRNEKGEQYKWPTVKKRLIENGYSVKDGRRNDLRYNIIERPNL